MVELLTTGWNVKRVVFLILGITLLGQGFTDHQWVPILLGGYFTYQAIFKKGCCGDNCAI